MNRLEVVRTFLADNSISAILMSDPIEVRYITGLKSSNMYLIIREESAVLFTDFRYREMAELFTSQNGWLFQELKENAITEIASTFAENEVVAIQSDSLTVDKYTKLKETAPSISFKMEGKSIASLFSIKSSEEINSIQQAASIADSALTKWVSLIEDGISEREAADRLERLCKARGSESPSFDTIVLFGERSALPHGVPSKERTLRAGDSILVDFGCTVNGQCSDMTRSFFFKNAPEPALNRYNITLEAQLLGVEAVCAGVKASDIDNVVRTVIDDAGYGELFGHGTGHGVGLRIHEPPSINKHDATVLQSGMVITVEPGIYVSGESGVRIEDLLVVTENGCQRLSQFPKELTIIQ